MAEHWFCLDLSLSNNIPEELQRLYGTRKSISEFLNRNPDLRCRSGKWVICPVGVLASNQWSITPYIEEFSEYQSLRSDDLVVNVWYIDDPHHGRLRCLAASIHRLECSTDAGKTYSPIPMRGVPYFGMFKLLKRDDDQVIKNTLAFVDGLVDDQEVSIPQALLDPKKPFMWPWWMALDLENKEEDKL
jgi:hypothetical protein